MGHTGRHTTRKVNKSLRAVIAVDGDVFLGQVAGEHPIAALAEAECDLEADLRLAHRGAGLGFVVGGVAAPPVGGPGAAQPEPERCAVGPAAATTPPPQAGPPPGPAAGSAASAEPCPASQPHPNPADPAPGARPAPGTGARPPATTSARPPARRRPRRRRRKLCQPDRLNNKLRAALSLGPVRPSLPKSKAQSGVIGLPAGFDANLAPLQSCAWYRNKAQIASYCAQVVMGRLPGVVLEQRQRRGDQPHLRLVLAKGCLFPYLRKVFRTSHERDRHW